MCFAAAPCPANSAVSSIAYTAGTGTSVASEPWAQLCRATSCGMTGLTAGCFNFVTGAAASPAGVGTSALACGAGEIVQAVYAVWDNLAVQEIVDVQCRRALPHRCCSFRQFTPTINGSSVLFVGDASQQMSDWHPEMRSPASPSSPCTCAAVAVCFRASRFARHKPSLRHRANAVHAAYLVDAIVRPQRLPWSSTSCTAFRSMLYCIIRASACRSVG